MLNERQIQVLRYIIDEYVRTAEPVSSKGLCDRYDLDCSSATVRNDMSALEEGGFITQPHTSAGRVPTEKAYRYYIANVLPSNTPKTVNINITFRTVLEEPVFEDRLKQIGEALAHASGDAVMMATSRPWSATLGLGNLIRKPDFRTEEQLMKLASDLERFDTAIHEILRGVYPERLRGAQDDTVVVLGDDNPFGSSLGSVVARHRLPNGMHGVMSIIGPMRMDYGRNVALLNQAKKIIEQPLLV